MVEKFVANTVAGSPDGTAVLGDTDGEAVVVVSTKTSPFVLLLLGAWVVFGRLVVVIIGVGIAVLIRLGEGLVCCSFREPRPSIRKNPTATPRVNRNTIFSTTV